MIFPFCVYALFASTLIVNKFLLQTLPVNTFVSIRLLASTPLVAISLWGLVRSRFFQLKQDFLLLLFITASTIVIPGLLKAYGLQNLYASKVILLGCLDQVITALYAWWIFNESLTRTKCIGIVNVLVGIVLLCFFDEWKPNAHFLIFSLPELAILVYVLVVRLGWMMAQRLLKHHRYTPTELNTLMIGIGGILSLVVLGPNGYGALIKYSFWTNTKILMFLYSIIIGTIVSKILYGHLLKRHGANFVTLSGFLEPLFVIALGWLFLGEQWPLHNIIPAVFIVTGVYLFYREECKTTSCHRTRYQIPLR